jgi:leucyl-tRNA synthetase
VNEYTPHSIEKKWREKWASNPYFATSNKKSEKKYYCLDMFPYPSGSGLHVGHWKGYVFSDVYARIKLLQGHNVLHPMGWDAFGLPAENDAIKKGIHPKVGTARNVATFKEQLKQIGAIYDWSKELDTTDPEYYRWTQWIFIQMFNAGLAYEADMAINWCTSCLTGLANEEVVGGACERCGNQVVDKKIRQWVLKITKYAEQLLNDLDELEWPEKVKLMQKNWIGKSEGLLFSAPIKGMNLTIQTFSAHFEAFAADTFVTIAPDHELLATLIADAPNKAEIEAFCKGIIARRLEKDYSAETQECEGIFTGKYIVDPISGNDLPIWVASFVLKDYGTGIVKCSAHDERDFAFAKKYGIHLSPVLFPEEAARAEEVKKLAYCFTDMKQGILTAPAAFAGKKAGDVRQDIITYCVEKGYAVPKTSYKLRDWIFSRQRYWGEPIPLVHCAQCGIVAVPESELPVLLPEVEKYQPTGTGESPLAAIDEWVNTSCPSCKGPAKRETNTMPQWAGSCWYFLRYPNPAYREAAFSQEDMKYWLPVDLYVGGIEHAVLHLLYARFYVKVLHDLGFLPFKEPFKKLFNQGMVCMKSPVTGRVEKMSKSKGNVVNPDEIVQQFGADTLRMYMLFMGPPELDNVWDHGSICGVHSFLKRLWVYVTDPAHLVDDSSKVSKKHLQIFHSFIKDYQERLDEYKVNTAVSAAMEFLNNASKESLVFSREMLESFLTLLSLMVPHLASELLEQVLGVEVTNTKWPTFDPALTVKSEVEIAVQINGKLRATVEALMNEDEAAVTQKAQGAASKWLDGQTIVKTIFVKNRLVNFVIKG